MRRLLLIFAACLMFPSMASAAVVSGYDNATPFKNRIAASGTWINDASFAAPVYDMCVPWRPPYAPCPAGNWERINFRNLDWDGSVKFPALDRRWDGTPLPEGWKPANGSDRQMVVLNHSGSGQCEYCEFWGVGQRGGGWAAVWGGGAWDGEMIDADGLKVWPTDGSRCGYTDPNARCMLGTAASGIAMVPGLIRIDDLKRNYIDHPVMFSVPNACQHYKPPATREDGMGGADCIQYGAKLKLPASVNIDAIRTDHRWCAPGPGYYNGSGGGRTWQEAQAAGWDESSHTCPLTPLGKMLARVMQDRFIVATDQTYWGGPITFSFESYDRPRVGNWANVPAGNPYGPYTGCDGIQQTGQWIPSTNTTGGPVGDSWEQDCGNVDRDFPWSQAYEVQ